VVSDSLVAAPHEAGDWWRRIRVSVLVMVVSLLLAEVISRVNAKVRGRSSERLGSGSTVMTHDPRELESRIGMGRLPRTVEKSPHSFRILALGDEITAGVGVSAPEAYPAVLASILGPPFEVVNLGLPGAHSEEVDELVREQFQFAECLSVSLPVGWADRSVPPTVPCRRFDLKPDLIVYGVTWDAFLPAGAGHRSHTAELAVSFPGQPWLLEHSAAAGIVADGYDRALVLLGIRLDLWKAATEGAAPLRERFIRDVTALDRVLVAYGLPPAVAMVVSARPGQRPTLLAATEDALRSAGATVVHADYYFRRAGEDWSVSPEEPRPNATAHRVFAESFAARIRELAAARAAISANGDAGAIAPEAASSSGREALGPLGPPRPDMLAGEGER